jgi:uncharacterized protein YbaR (Trm112 family)
MKDSLLSILACPVTKSPLTRGGAPLVERYNNLVSKKCLTTVQGKTVDERADELLVSIHPTDARVYRIVSEIPVLLPDEGVALAVLADTQS